MGKTDRIDRGSQIENERAAKQRFSTWPLGGRYLRERSRTSRSVAREKALQTATLKTVQAMRSILCDAVENIALLFRGLLTDRGPFKAALNAFVAEDHLLGGRGVAASLWNGFYAHQPQATRSLVADRGSNLLLPLPRINVLTGCRVLARAHLCTDVQHVVVGLLGPEC
jgi:hypothetical protein